MILATIGRCVTAMNKNYWNEYRERLVDKDIEKKTLKMYQYLLPKKDNSFEEFINLLELTNLIKPDIYLASIEINEASIPKNLYRIFYNLKEFIERKGYIYCLPVINIHKTISKELTVGTYFFDITEKRLLKYNNKTFQPNNISSSRNITILWLLDVKSAIVLYNKPAFFNGMKHTLQTKYMVCQDIEYEEYEIYLNQQGILKEIGLNSRELLIIDTMYLL